MVEDTHESKTARQTPRSGNNRAATPYIEGDPPLHEPAGGPPDHEGKGYLKREPRKARGIAIVREPEDDIPDLVAVPIIGRVAAGQPILAEENIIGEVLVEGGVARAGRCFALEVTGDSMVDAGIRERDLVVVRQQPVAENGDIVVALLEDEATVKRLYIRGEKIELRPENRKHRPIPVGPDDGLRIIGKVVAIRRPGSETQTPGTAWL